MMLSSAARRIGLACVAVVVCLGAAISFRFEETGSLAVVRSGASAVLLDNGKVLVAGGTTDRTCELYDPASGTWSTTASLVLFSSQGQTATLMNDGKVLVVGGFNATALKTAQLYDPDTETWSLSGSIATPRFHHTATLLTDGKVLIAGGQDNNLRELASTELYDPATGSWTTVSPLVKARGYHVATLLLDGKVLVAGGTIAAGGIGKELASAELYDPATGSWSRTGSMKSARVRPSMTLLKNGQALVVGGQNFTPHGDPASAELYDPASGTWKAAGFLPEVRWGHTATLLNNGTVLVAGGITSAITNAADIFNPKDRTWTPTGSLVTPRMLHTATLLNDGRVLIANGAGPGGPALATAELGVPDGQ
jgi:N-acetylneuraminic acid mutarotase